MKNSNIERAARRLTILDGINGGITRFKIAEKLGVSHLVVKRDLNVMRRRKDPELKQAYIKGRERVLAKKLAVSNRPGEKFQRMTGMTFKEKTFNNMMSYYGPELRKILKAESEGDAIRDLPASIKKTLKRNGIITLKWKVPKITAYARTCLTGIPSLN